MPELRLEGVSKYYKVDRRKRMAVQDIDLTIEQGEFVFLDGSSGAASSLSAKCAASSWPVH